MGLVLESEYEEGCGGLGPDPRAVAHLGRRGLTPHFLYEKVRPTARAVESMSTPGKISMMAHEHCVENRIHRPLVRARSSPR